MSFVLDTSDAYRVAGRFAKIVATYDGMKVAALAQGGIMGVALVKAKASGRPGPRAVTGDYRRSWNARITESEAVIGTNAVQARRLEYGFVGADSLGRVYNQPPYPHLRPAVEQLGPKWQKIVEKLVKQNLT